MNAEQIKIKISKLESIKIELKKCKEGLSKNVYDTVCSFLNRFGGELILGISDNGDITGINQKKISQIKKEFANTINNSQKINPPAYLGIEEVDIENKKILYINIPESSQVHRCSGRIFDRNEDGDFDITDNTNLVSSMYLRKQNSFTENEVYPYLKISDLREDLMLRAKRLAGVQQENHPWLSMNNEELLRSAGLYLFDYKTGNEGYTLAAALLFGKDEVIASIVPYFRIDAILRKNNLDRYDDRDDIRTNLIECYDRIITFTEKHLPDPFYLEGDQRISVRGKIVREIASNILIHREYRNAYPAKIIIESDKIITENGNNPHLIGEIDLKNFTPYPKNPTLAKFFKNIGRADELGSGSRNLSKFSKIYSNSTPHLIEGDIFKTIINIPSDEYIKLQNKKLIEGGTIESKTGGAINSKTGGAIKITKREKEILELIESNKKTPYREMAVLLKINYSAMQKHFEKLKEKGLLKRIGGTRGYWKIIKEKNVLK